MNRFDGYVLRLQKHKEKVFIATAFIYALILLAVCLIFDFNGLYGQDSYAYLLYTKKVSDFFSFGYPAGDFFWPVGYPFFSSILNLLIRNENISCILISVFSSALTFVFLYKILLALYPEKKENVFIYLILFYCLSPFVFRMSIVVMSEMLAILFITVVFYCFMLYRHSGRFIYFLLIVLFSSLSIFVRYPCFIIVIIPLVLSLIQFLRNIKSSHLINLALVCLVLIFMFNFSFEDNKVFCFLQNDFLHAWSFLNYFKSSFYTVDGYSHYAFINILYPLAVLVNPGFITGGFIFIFFMRKTEWKNVFFRPVLLSVLLYSLFLAGIPFQNLRVLSLSFSLVLIFLFPAFVNLLEEINSFKKYYPIAFMFIILMQVAFIFRAMYPFYKMNKSEKMMAYTLKKYTQYETLYTSGSEGFLKVYDTHFVLKSIWEKKIDSFNKKSLILVNPAELENQWKGKNPYINWINVKSNYSILKLESLPSGWELYEIR